MIERYAEQFPSLRFDSPQEGILELIIAAPGRLNAADRRMHRDLAGVWQVIARDREIDVVIVRGEGGAFSAGGDLKAMLSEMHCRIDGCAGSRGGSMHLVDFKVGMAGTSAIVAGSVPIATGAALAAKMQRADRAVAVFNFGGDKTATAGDLTIIFPTADASNAIIRLV